MKTKKKLLSHILIHQDPLTSASDLFLPHSFYPTKHQNIFQLILPLSHKPQPIHLLIMTSPIPDQALLQEL
ncbi:DnaB-like helicase N-terminal domain-containing protein, partial [Bacillus thuringiensis]|uniref:DnaB-like helicase N-terminal domain-containing protein n=1 Tax=Bacillus thuringiensis TaxID=1428 RepID=UPI003C12F88C